MKSRHGSVDEPIGIISENINKIEHDLEQAWGRKTEATWTTAAFSLLLVVVCPLVVVFNWAALEHFEGSATATLSTLSEDGPIRFYSIYGPKPTTKASLGYAAWLVFQGLVYQFLPGPISTGQMTPAGNLLKYKTNGLRAWIITHVLFLAAGATGTLDLAIIAKNFPGLLVAVVTYGLFLALFAQIKAHIAPSHPTDRKFSGSFIFDYFAGIEMNPRFGELWDFKLFHNGRPGIIAWTLISLSYTAYQYQQIGYVTNSLILVDLFHFIYVVDFFYNESWYLRTIDMAHDHFGYYLGFGSVAVVPNLYTIQAQYLARYPVDLPTTQAVGILAVGIVGYVIFRGANYQKDVVRATGGKCDVWGKPAKFIRAPYKTSDGQAHESLLLTSGNAPFFSYYYYSCLPTVWLAVVGMLILVCSHRMVGSFSARQLSR